MSAKHARRRKRPGRKGQVGTLLPELTETGLLALLESEVLTRRQKPPCERCLQELVRELKTLRFIASSRSQDDIETRKQNNHDMLTVLSEIMRLTSVYVFEIDQSISHFKVMQETLVARSSDDDGTNRKVLKMYLDMMNTAVQNRTMFVNLRKAAQEIQTTVDHGLYMSYNEIFSFHDIAYRLVDAFLLAMRPTNPGLKFSRYSLAGPCQRFIVAVMPHITGECPNTQ